MRSWKSRFFAELIFALVLVGFTWQNVAYPTNIKSDESSKQTVQSGRQLSNSQRLASEAVDTFLKGVKLIDLPEGKALLARCQWITGEADNGANFYARPIYTKAKTIFEALFNTDVPGIIGYKRLMEMDAVSETRTTLKLRFIAIAYSDKKTGEWKVLGTGTDDSVDIERNVQYFEQNLTDTRYSSEQDNYLTYGNWLFRAGRIKEAKEALLKARGAKQFSDSDPRGRIEGKYVHLHQVQIERLLRVIERVAGG